MVFYCKAGQDISFELEALRNANEVIAHFFGCWISHLVPGKLFFGKIIFEGSIDGS